MNFSQFQEHFLKAMKDSVPDLLLEKILIPIGDLAQDQVLDIYRRDYAARLGDVIGQNYESVWFVLGDEDFAQERDAFVKAHPSSLRDLGEYGKNFPEFISQRPCMQDFPFLGQLALLERDYWELFHAPPAPSYENLKQEIPTDIENTVLTFPFGSKTYSWPWSIGSLFRQRQSKEQEVDWDMPESALLCKVGQQVKLVSLSIDQKLFTEALLEGLPIGQALSCAPDIAPKDVNSVFVIFKELEIKWNV